MSECCVYFVEDNEADLMLLRLALRSQPEDVEVHIAKDGEEALNLIDEIIADVRCHPDLIVLDLNIPKHSGIEVLTFIRSKPQLRSAPVVVLTSSDAPSDRRATEALGISGYWRKPMNLEGFLQLGPQLLAIATRSAGSAE